MRKFPSLRTLPPFQSKSSFIDRVSMWSNEKYGISKKETEREKERRWTLVVNNESIVSVRVSDWIITVTYHERASVHLRWYTMTYPVRFPSLSLSCYTSTLSSFNSFSIPPLSLCPFLHSLASTYTCALPYHHHYLSCASVLSRFRSFRTLLLPTFTSRYQMKGDSRILPLAVRTVCIVRSH